MAVLMENVLMEVKPLGYFSEDEGGDIYNAAVREWISWQIRDRGHDCDRGKIRNVSFGIHEGFHGTDVTPADEWEAGLKFELRRHDHKVGWWTNEDGWMKQEWPLIDSPSQFVVECSAIASKLAWLHRQGAKDAMIWD